MTRYFCDRCGEEAKLRRVTLRYSSRLSIISSEETVIKDYCDKCLEEIGLKDPGLTDTVPARTAQDRLYDIIREIVSEVAHG